jgi:hypothetical protein
LGLEILAGAGEQVGGVIERHHVEQAVYRHARMPFLPHDGVPLAAVIGIDEIEMKQRRNQPIGRLLAVIPTEHLLDARQETPLVCIVAAIAPIIVHHRHPCQRVERRELLQFRGEARLRQAEGRAGSVELLQRLAVERVVAGGREPGQRVQLGVAHVLDPLPGQIAHEDVLRA